MNWSLDELSALVVRKIPAFEAQVLPSIDSTNSELMRRAKSGYSAPLLLVAEEQTAGKGRLGKTWHSQPGQSLTFSIGLALSLKDWSGFSLAVGLGILKALDPNQQYGLGIKWPNDIWIGPTHAARKLGGILIESTISSHHNLSEDPSRYCVIGVGINVVTPKGLDLQRAAAGVLEFDSNQSAQSVLLKVVPQIINNVIEFESLGFAAFKDEFANYDILAGQQISMNNGLVGRACGVNARGELMIQTTSGMVPVTSDEVSLVGFGAP
jgi:BirA family biotin operon repressor/biotin-[acetyl-CoA-carboxylase] ligase